MKIVINGSMIDTKNISMIDKIEHEQRVKTLYYFTIYFINKDSISVSIKGSNYGDLDWSSENYEKLLNVRNNIIKLWLDGQENVPEFNLN